MNPSPSGACFLPHRPLGHQGKEGVESASVAVAGVELDPGGEQSRLPQAFKALSLAFTALSCSVSLLICSASFLIRSLSLLTRKISFSSCFIRCSCSTMLCS